MLHNVKTILKVTWLCSLRQVKHRETRTVLNKFETPHANEHVAFFFFLLKYSVTKVVEILFSSP